MPEPSALRGEGSQGDHYDGLDRRNRTTVTKPDGNDADSDPDVTVRDLTYLGTTELLAREAPAGAPAGEVRMAFDYDSRGDRIGQQSSRNDRFYTYDKDANGSVLGLEEDGDDPETGSTEVAGEITPGKSYRYDPYGALDADEVSATSPDEGDRYAMETGAAENPFRFEGFYADSAADSYDMHARSYGARGAQFLSRDVYASAAGDFALTADLLTQNRYAFAGGNPAMRRGSGSERAATSSGLRPPDTTTALPTQGGRHAFPDRGTRAAASASTTRAVSGFRPPDFAVRARRARSSGRWRRCRSGEDSAWECAAPRPPS